MSCKNLLADPKISEHTKDLLSLVLKNLENNISNPDPILFRALLAETKNKDKTCLCLGISEGSRKVVGIGIREKRILSNGENQIIEEEYPAAEFEDFRIVNEQLIPVVIRKNNNRKNEKEWENYLKFGPLPRELFPKLLVSIPKPGQTEVEIWIYDSAGNKSNVCPLENISVSNPD